MLNINIRKMNRWQAFAIHSGISLLIFLILLLLIVYIWYPGVFLYAGGTEGIKIVAGVDFVLGPLLTLIVFNPLKKSLKLDLFVISLIQTLCLAAGTWLVFNERPLAQVLVNEKVYVLTAADYRHFNVDTLPLEAIDGAYPKKILLNLPTKSNLAIMLSEMADAKPIAFRTDLYIPMINLSEEDEKDRFEKLQYDLDRKCWIIEITSPHLEKGKGCLNIEKGIVSLE